MGMIRKAWDHPVPWTVVRRASVAAGMSVVVYQLAIWVGQEADPIWALFRIAVAVGLVALVAFVGWGALSGVLAGIEIHTRYDPPKGERAEWSGSLTARHSNRGVLVVDE
jgi:hypothetical protein